jgi:MFS family permease
MQRDGVWQNGSFRLLIGGQLVSQLGNQLQGLALPLIVLAITGSATQAGLLLGISTAAYLLVGLVAGALVDRWNRRRTMIRCELARAALTATVPIAVLGHALTMVQLYIVAVGAGVLTVLFHTANSTALPNIVRPEHLPDALGATRAAGSALGIAGAAVAGAAYGLGRAVPFAVNAISFLVSALTLSRIRAEFQETENPERPSVRGLLGDIRQGLGWIWAQPVLRLLTVVEAADAVRYGAGYLIIIELARRVGADALQVGLVFSGAGIGGLLGGLAAGRIAGRFRLGRVAIGMLWVEAIAFPLYAVAPSWWWLAGVALLESVITPIYSVAMDTYRISITPDQVRGRVSGALGTLITGAMSIGTILGGLLLTSIGAPALALGCGVWLLALAALTTSSATIRRSGAQPLERAAEPVPDARS